MVLRRLAEFTFPRGCLDSARHERTPSAQTISIARLSAADGGHEVLARYQKKYPTAGARGKLTLAPIGVRETVDAVSVAAKWTLEYLDKPPATGHPVVVFRRWNGQWRIVHDASL